MLFMETIPIRSENRMKHIAMLFGKMQSFLMFKQVVHIVTITETGRWITCKIFVSWGRLSL
jgi:hypothetical protein